jgi:hypothetical protein
MWLYQLSGDVTMPFTVDKTPLPTIIMALQPSVEPWPLFQFLNPIHSR